MLTPHNVTGGCKGAGFDRHNRCGAAVVAMFATSFQCVTQEAAYRWPIGQHRANIWTIGKSDGRRRHGTYGGRIVCSPIFQVCFWEQHLPESFMMVNPRWPATHGG